MKARNYFIVFLLLYGYCIINNAFFTTVESLIRCYLFFTGKAKGWISSNSTAI